MRWRFEQAVEEDREAVLALAYEAFGPLVERTWGGWDAARRARVREAWSAAHTRVVRVEGELAGAVRLFRRDDEDWLDLIVLGAAWRGSGLGTEVMRALAVQAHARGVPLVLSVHRINAASRLYRRLGFHEEPSDELRLRMWLPPV